MDKEILTFGYIEIEKNKFYQQKTSYYLQLFLKECEYTEKKIN